MLYRGYLIILNFARDNRVIACVIACKIHYDKIGPNRKYLREEKKSVSRYLCIFGENGLTSPISGASPTQSLITGLETSSRYAQC